jgi:hypothetical protein
MKENKIGPVVLSPFLFNFCTINVHTYCLCRLIWNKYRKYKMRTYINTLHQTFRYGYTHLKMIFVTKLRKNLLLLRSDMRTCRVLSESVVQECEEHEGPRRVPAVAHPAPRPPPNICKIPGKVNQIKINKIRHYILKRQQVPSRVGRSFSFSFETV